MSTIVYTTSRYEEIAEKIKCWAGNTPSMVADIDTIKVAQFPDGEDYLKLLKPHLWEYDAIVVGGTQTDTDLLELYDLTYAVSKAGARRITVYIPYYGYSTMERAVKRGEIVKAKTRAVILSSLPGIDRITFIMTDLHSAGIEHYFEGSCHTIHHYAKDPVLEHCRAIGDDIVLASTDAGRAKWVESLANDLMVDCAFIIKRRVAGDKTEIAGINADVQNRVVVIYDDMVRTGGSLVAAGKAYRDAGAREVHAIVTHGVLPGDSVMRMEEFNSFACSDTVPGAVDKVNRLRDGKGRIFSVVDQSLINELFKI